MFSKLFNVLFLFLILLFKFSHAQHVSTRQQLRGCPSSCRRKRNCPSHCKIMECKTNRFRTRYSCTPVSNRATITIIPETTPSISPQPTSAYAHVIGDPHFRTLDGVDFDCMGRGEYILASSIYAPWFRLHGRFEGKGFGSVTTGLALRHQSGFIEVSITKELDSDFSVIIGECPVFIWITRNKRHSTPIKPIQFKRQSYSRVEIEYDLDRLIIYFNDGIRLYIETVRTSSFGCYFSIGQLLIPPSIQSKEFIRGLFGSADNDPSNDFRRRNNGRIIKKDVTLSTAASTRYCSQWCIRNPYFSAFNTYYSNITYDFSVCGRSPFFAPHSSKPFIRSSNSSKHSSLTSSSSFTSKRIFSTQRQDDDFPTAQEIENVCGDNQNCRFDAVTGGLKAARAFMRALFISEAIGRDPASISPRFSNAPVVRISQRIDDDDDYSEYYAQDESGTQYFHA